MNDVIALKDIAKNLNSISWDILDILSKKENIKYNELKKILKISQEKAYKEIARLEGALLIFSKQDDRDKRILRFNITENGLKILNYRN